MVLALVVLSTIKGTLISYFDLSTISATALPLALAAVGEAIGKRAGHVRVIQFRALAKLKDELLRRGYGGEEMA